MSTVTPHQMMIHSGRYVNPVDLKPEEIWIQDIQHALSNICRFGGHGPFYSVAQHSVLVSEHIRVTGHPARYQLAGLLHDASEAYLGDIIRPLKRQRMFEEFNDVEDALAVRIFGRFGLPTSHQESWDMWAVVKYADVELLASECINLFNKNPDEWGLNQPSVYIKVTPVEPREAKVLFETRFHELQVLIADEKGEYD